MAGRLRIRQAILANRVSLLFVCLPTAFGYVEPPTNVTFHCHNLHDRLQWSYNQSVAGLRFRVEIRSEQSPPLKVWVNPPALHANVSHLTNPADDNMLTVTAVVGQNESEAAPADGILFSYFRGSLMEHKCSVDLPPVVVTVNPDGHILFHFEHPWLVYGSRLPQAKSRKKKSNEEKMLTHTPEFRYTVKVNEHLEETHVCDTNTCEGKLPVDPGQDRQCLDVKGETQMIFVRGSQQYCASSFTLMPHKQNKDIYIVAGALTVVAVIAVALAVFIVYKKKTLASDFSPNAVMIDVRRKPGTLNLQKDQVSVPEVDSRSPDPLLTDDNEYEDVTPAAPSTEAEQRFCLGVESKVEEEGCDEGSEYMPGSEVEAAPDNGSGYEQRPGVRVELAPGEAAKGYRQGEL